MKNSLRDLILDLLEQRHLLTAPELLQALEAHGLSFNKTSLYRALDKLQADGLICKQNLLDNDLVYELRSHHHDHLVCTCCGKVEAAECQLTTPAAPHHFLVDHHHLTLYGTCAECQA